MKKLLAVLCLIVFVQTAFAGAYVKGYYRKNGTYVAPHYRQDSYKQTIKKLKTGTIAPSSAKKRARTYNQSKNFDF